MKKLLMAVLLATAATGAFAEAFCSGLIPDRNSDTGFRQDCIYVETEADRRAAAEDRADTKYVQDYVKRTGMLPPGLTSPKSKERVVESISRFGSSITIKYSDGYNQSCTETLTGLECR